MDWRELVFQYLTTCLAEARGQCSNPKRDAFIQQFGTSELINATSDWADHVRERLLSQTVPAKEDFHVVEETVERVVVELDKRGFGDLICDTRYVIVKIKDQWRLRDVLWPCTCKAGACPLCQGSGCCTVCKGRPLSFSPESACPLCNGNPECSYCNGSGRCDQCQKSSMRGWKSRLPVVPN